VAELFDGLRVVGDVEAAGLDAGVGADDEVAGEDLGGLHGPETRAVEGAELGVVAVFLDGVGDAVGRTTACSRRTILWRATSCSGRTRGRAQSWMKTWAMSEGRAPRAFMTESWRSRPPWTSTEGVGA
jgi:hypothetical protein